MNYAKSLILQLVLRAIAVGFLSIFLYRIYEVMSHRYALNMDFNLNLVLLAVGEIITVAIVLFARFAKEARLDFLTGVSTVVASFYFLALGLNNGVSLVPVAISTAIQTVGIAWQIYAKLCLGLSFGLLPANRGIVTHGAYKVVRHPIYFGYFINHIGFLLSAFSVWNFLLYAILYFFQGVRIWQEEKLLKNDPAYALYMTKTKYRFLPFVF